MRPLWGRHCRPHFLARISWQANEDRDPMKLSRLCHGAVALPAPSRMPPLPMPAERVVPPDRETNTPGQAPCQHTVHYARATRAWIPVAARGSRGAQTKPRRTGTAQQAGPRRPPGHRPGGASGRPWNAPEGAHGVNSFLYINKLRARRPDGEPKRDFRHSALQHRWCIVI